MYGLDPRLRGGDKKEHVIPAKEGIQALHEDSHIFVDVVVNLTTNDARSLCPPPDGYGARVCRSC